MKKRNKWFIGLGAVLAAYLLYPSEEPKVIEPVKVEKKVSKPKIDFKKINELLNKNNPQENNLEDVVEKSNLPSCLQCEDWKPKVTRLYSNKGYLIERVTKCCGVMHGEQIDYYENGRIFRIRNFFCGKAHGEFISYDPNGKITSKKTFKNNKQDGEKIMRRGLILYKLNYKEGKLHGRQEYLWLDQLEEITNYKNGKKDGEYKQWYIDAEKDPITRSINIEGNFKDGKRDGCWKLYDTGGHLFRVKCYDNNGQLVKKDRIYHPDFESAQYGGSVFPGFFKNKDEEGF